MRSWTKKRACQALEGCFLGMCIRDSTDPPTNAVAMTSTKKQTVNPVTNPDQQVEAARLCATHARRRREGKDDFEHVAPPDAPSLQQDWIIVS